MAKVTFILGLCGSGKTFTANKMAGVKKFDEDFIVEEHQQQELFNAQRGGKDCVVIEVNYCWSEFRDPFVQRLLKEVPGTTIEWIAFENDLATANRNCQLRENKGDAVRHMEINGRLSRNYTMPPGADVKTIFPLQEKPAPA